MGDCGIKRSIIRPHNTLACVINHCISYDVHCFEIFPDLKVGFFVYIGGI